MYDEQIFVSYVVAERIGKYYKIFSMNVNDVKYYFVCNIEKGGFEWVYGNKEDAVDMFEAAEKDAEEYQVLSKQDVENWRG